MAAIALPAGGCLTESGRGASVRRQARPCASPARRPVMASWRARCPRSSARSLPGSQLCPLCQPPAQPQLGWLDHVMFNKLCGLTIMPPSAERHLHHQIHPPSCLSHSSCWLASGKGSCPSLYVSDRFNHQFDNSKGKSRTNKQKNSKKVAGRTWSLSTGKRLTIIIKRQVIVPRHAG